MRTHILAGALLLLASTTPVLSAPARDEPERSADSGSKTICKKFIRTGSLVDGYRVCKSKREWQNDRDDLRQMSVSDSCSDRANGGQLCKL